MAIDFRRLAPELSRGRVGIRRRSSESALFIASMTRGDGG